jgi:hypothetical protein
VGFKVKAKITLRLVVYRQAVRLGDKPVEDDDWRYFSAESLRS